MTFRIALLLVAVALSSDRTVAATFDPALIYGPEADQNDNAYYEAVTQGARRFASRHQRGFHSYFVDEGRGYEATVRLAADTGYDPVLAVGPFFADAVAVVAPDYPDTRFTLIDSRADAPNIRSVVFREYEGAFLVGVLAAMQTASGGVGFVGGMDTAYIRRFGCGFAQGVHFQNPDVTVRQRMTGDTPEAWVNPDRGRKLARELMEVGADIVFQAAGKTGLGVIHEVADAGRLVIGVDVNQNGMRPGRVLTSMLKRVDVAVYSELRLAQQNEWEPGSGSLGLAEEGVGWAFDEHNALLISNAMYHRVEEVRQAIEARRIHVHDALTEGPCPHPVAESVWSTGWRTVREPSIIGVFIGGESDS